MNSNLRLGFIVASLTACIGLVCSSGDAHVRETGDLEKTVKSIAESIKNNKMDDAKKKAVAAAKKIDDLADLMEMYSTLEISSQLKKMNAKMAAESGHTIAAMAELTLAKTPTKEGNKGRTKAAWTKFSEQLRPASLDLAKANTDATAVKAAERVNNACKACHDVFKDN
jgi:Zn-dependent M16 (insulinase) family peptidase